MPFILVLDAHNSKQSLTLIFYYWKIISMQLFNFLHFTKNSWEQIESHLNFSKYSGGSESEPKIFIKICKV